MTQCDKLYYGTDTTTCEICKKRLAQWKCKTHQRWICEGCITNCKELK